MKKFHPLQEPIRLQDLLNSARSRAEKNIVAFIKPEKPLISPLIFPFTVQRLVSDDFYLRGETLKFFASSFIVLKILRIAKQRSVRDVKTRNSAGVLDAEWNSKIQFGKSRQAHRARH